ncbi:MAG: DNA ligase D [Gemmatimonadota bacterium]
MSTRARFLPVQLATLVEIAPDDSGWTWETKYDGYRLEAVVRRGAATLYTRNGNDWTDRFPTIAAAFADITAASAVIDGEVVILSARSANFRKLQDFLGGDQSLRPVYFAFDLLELDGRDLRGLPLAARRVQLDRLLKGATGDVRIGQRLRGAPATLLARVCAQGREGIIGKRLDATYHAGRDSSWIKLKCGKRQEFVILGYTAPKNSRSGFGSLLLGVHDATGLRYAGRVGSGFSDALLRSMHRTLESLAVAKAPTIHFPERPPRGVHWVRPKLVAEVSFSEWTASGSLRHPVFIGLRQDKPAHHIQKEVAAMTRSPAATTHRRQAKPDSGTTVAGVEISHPDRIVYPEAGITKLELARFLERFAPLMLPHVGNRPLSLVRCPEGIAEECFFQKHWTGKLPDSLTSVAITQSDRAKHPYVVVRDARGLVTLAQWGVMEIHPWGARADAPERPDRILFDLDPGPGVSWDDVRSATFGLRSLLDELGLDSWVKTSGGKGLHIMVPIARTATWKEVASFAQAVAVHMATHFPDRFIAKASKAARRGVIFVDWLRNTRGATAVGTWSPRARVEAGVSVPISWRALASIASGNQHTLPTLQDAPLPRSDPWRAVLESRQRLTKAMRKQIDV